MYIYAASANLSASSIIIGIASSGPLDRSLIRSAVCIIRGCVAFCLASSTMSFPALLIREMLDNRKSPKSRKNRANRTLTVGLSRDCIASTSSVKSGAATLFPLTPSPEKGSLSSTSLSVGRVVVRCVPLSVPLPVCGLAPDGLFLP